MRSEKEIRETLRSWVLSKAKNLHGSAPGNSAPDHGAPDHGAPDHGAPDHGAPDHGAPDDGAPDDGALTDSTPLFEERRLRSLHLPELLLLLERLRGEPIDVDDLRPGDFRDIDTLVSRFCGVGVTA